MAIEIARETSRQQGAAPIRLTVTVTAEDIAAGDRGDSAACPIARAMRRLFEREPGKVRAAASSLVRLQWPLVLSTTALLPSGRWAPLPPDARGFIARYDAGAAVAPFRFQLAVAS